MNVLREARKRLVERNYYGRPVSEDYLADQLKKWNTAPPTRTKFCNRCGSEIRWYRETPSYNVATGKHGHTYHLVCRRYGDFQYEMDLLPAGPGRAETSVLYSNMHYNSHEYRWREDDRESFEQEDLW